MFIQFLFYQLHILVTFISLRVINDCLQIFENGILRKFIPYN